MTTAQPNSQSNRSAKEEWRSWKIQYPYLTVLLLLTFGFIFVIAALTAISRRDLGFVRQSQPPRFFQRNPGLRKAIWEQGIFYTAFPAFIMTVYRTMWDATVMAFADRQPYVDLMKVGGRHPRRTILLDYKMEPLLHRWILAFQNKHFLLSACMLSSLVLSFGIVPLTSFLFTMDSSLSNSTFPLTTDTYFNGTIVPQLLVFSNEPNVRLILDTAAGLHVQNLSLPPRTDGTFAFPHFTLQADVGSSNVSLQTAAYGVDSGCIEILESEYDKKIRWYENKISIDVRTIDRMCAISGTLDIRPNLFSPDIWLSSWYTPTCGEAAGWTRMSLLAARYDRVSQTVQDFSFLSCNSWYFATAGYLMERSEPGMSPRFLRFDEDAQQKMELGWQESYMSRMFLEKEVHDLRYFDPSTTVDANEFAKYVYRMAQHENPKGPLEPKALVTAAQTLYETVYAVFASVHLFKERDIPLNGTGVYMIEERRLFVQPVVAYVILGVLSVTAVLIACLFLYSQQRSMLKEEPFGLMSYAGILFRSNINTDMMGEIVGNGYDPGTARESAKKMYHLDQVRWLYDEACGRITFRGPFPMQTFATNGGPVVPPRRNPSNRVVQTRWRYGDRLQSGFKSTWKTVSDRGKSFWGYLLYGVKSSWTYLWNTYIYMERKLFRLMRSI